VAVVDGIEAAAEEGDAHGWREMIPRRGAGASADRAKSGPGTQKIFFMPTTTRSATTSYAPLRIKNIQKLR
jgi:hypothetical protein